MTDAEPSSVACWAPGSALYLRPDGQVHACCATAYSAGMVNGPGRQTLREIYDGVAMAAQRAALAAGSFELGCQECEHLVVHGDRASSIASEFDRYAPGAPHPFPQMIDFALSNRCNLQCTMCNGNLSSAIRAQREHLPPLAPAYDDEFFEELDEFLPHLQRAQFKGGEPFLARENRRIWDSLLTQGLTPQITVTTNGTIFDQQVADYVTGLRMHPIISVDAIDDDLLEEIRVGVSARAFWANVAEFQRVAALGGEGITLSFCLMANNWHQVAPFLLEAERLGTNANVIPVSYPPRFDLLRLPPNELAEVRTAMVAAAPAFRDERSEATWARVIRSLEPAPTTAVAVTVTAPHQAAPLATPPLAPHEIDQLRRELDVEHGAKPIEIALADNVVQSVTAPAWAAWLDAQDWQGLRLEAIGPAIERAAGGTLIHGTLPPKHRAVERHVLAVDGPGGRHTLWATTFARDATGHSTVWLDLAPEPEPRAR